MFNNSFLTLTCVALTLWAKPGITEPLPDQRAIVPIRDEGGLQLGIYRESHALVIGVSDYNGGWPRLPGVVNDINAVKDVLEQHGFKVETLIDPDQAALEQGYREFITRYGLNKDNRLLFYFAGHGHTHKPAYAKDDSDQWIGYIVSREAPSPKDDFADFRRHALSMQRFEELAKQVEAKHALFVFDSCFSGSIFQAMRSAPPSISKKPPFRFDSSLPLVGPIRRYQMSASSGVSSLHC